MLWMMQKNVLNWMRNYTKYVIYTYKNIFDKYIKKIYLKKINIFLIQFIYTQAYVRIIKCCLILGDIIQAETTLSKLLEIDPENKGITTEKKDLEYVKKFLKDADIAYAAKDYRKVCNSIFK